MQCIRLVDTIKNKVGTKKHIKIFNISLQGFKVRGAENRIVTVPTFVDKIAHCGLLVTNSFHGVVFANIYKRPYVYLKFDDERRNARVLSLLEGSSDEFRMINKAEEFIGNQDKFYSRPSLDLSSLRETGLEYIRKNLSK